MSPRPSPSLGGASFLGKSLAFASRASGKTDSGRDGLRVRWEIMKKKPSAADGGPESFRADSKLRILRMIGFSRAMFNRSHYNADGKFVVTGREAGRGKLLESFVNLRKGVAFRRPTARRRLCNRREVKV